MRQSQSESAAISTSSLSETIQLGPVAEEEEQSGSSGPIIGGGTEMSKGLHFNFLIKLKIGIFTAIMEMVHPAIEKLDEQVKNTRKSQLYLANHIDQLSTS